MDTSLQLLTQRIQQMKAAERQIEWPGYSNWRQSSNKVPESSWSGYSEWRTNDKEEQQRMMASLRLRLSKPAISPAQDVGAETDHFDRSSSLDKWHRSCWQQFRDSAAFDEETRPEDSDTS